MKRATAVILSIILVVSLLPLSALAVWTVPDIDISVTVSGSTVTTTVKMDAYTDLGNINFYLNYDKDKLQTASIVPSGVFTKFGDPTVNDINGSIIIATAGTGSDTTTEQTTILTVTFNIKDNATGPVLFSLSDVTYGQGDDEYTNPGGTHSAGVFVSPIAVSIDEPMKYETADTSVADGTGYAGDTSIEWSPELTGGKFAPGTVYTATATLTAAENYKFNTNQTVTIAGLSSDKIAYDAGNNATTLKFTATFPATAAQSLTEMTVTADPETIAVPTGSTAATVQFSATGKDGTETVPVTPTWSITSGTYTGISINSSTGVLSVDKTAATNTFSTNSLTVTVQAVFGSVSDTQTVTITRAASVATSVVVSGGQASIEVPVSGSATSSAFIATVYDQYGQTMPGTPEWSVTSVAGVSIDSSSGVVTVTSGAKDTILDTEGEELTVTATVSTVPGTDTITVKRAASVATTVTVGDGQTSIEVPASGSTSSSAFTATVYDQYGTEMAGTPEWSVTIATGVTIDGGVVTVASSAKDIILNTTGQTFTVTAAVGTVSGTDTITVKRAAAVYDKVEITRGTSDALTTDLLVIPQSAGNEYIYLARVYDQYGTAITDSAGVWSGTFAGTGITGVSFTGSYADSIHYGTVTVASTAAAASPAGTLIYTEGVSGSHDTATVTISLSTLEVDWAAVIPYNDTKTYSEGTTFASFVTLPPDNAGTANDGAAIVNGVFSVVNGTEMADVDDTTVTVQFTVTTAGEYLGLKFYNDYTIHVAKRTLTVTPTSGQTKAFGTTDPTLGYGYAGNVDGQTPGFTGALARASGEDVTAAGYEITQGTLTLADGSDFKAANYEINFIASVKFSITPATITITTPAPGHTVLANNPANSTTAELKTIANGGSALPTQVAIGYSDDQTGTFGIVWANAAETFSAKGGTYTYMGTVAENANYANRPTLTATVTVTPVTVTDVQKDNGLEPPTALPATITVAKADVLAAASLTDIGVPDTAYLTFDNSVAAMADQTIVWNKTLATTLADVQAVANTVTDASGDKTITLTVQAGTYPGWATAPAAAKTFTITITNKFPVDVTFDTAISDITYGTALATPVAAQAAIDHGTDSSGTFTYTYEGTGTTTYASNTTAPTNAGTYKVVATLVSSTHSGTGEDTFTIENKPLDNSMITAITPSTNTYTGSAITPAPTVADASLITAADYTVSWSNNVNAGSAAKVIITATAGGNYSGSAEFTFTIDKAELTGTPTVSGTAAVGHVLTANHTYPESEVTYQWTRGGADIAGATGKTYTLTSADSNQSIAVRVTGANVNYLNTSTITSVSKLVAKQAVSGTVVIVGGSSSVANGDTLAAVITGMVPGAAQTGATYQWTATSGGTTVNLGTSSSQALADLAADTVVTVTVTPNENYSGTLSASVTIGKTPLTATFTITGTDLAVGNIITPTGQVNEADLAANSADYALQWMRNGVDIAGATGTTYTITSADLGTSITLKAVGMGSCTGTVQASGAAAVAALAPNAPAITASAGNKQVTVKWTAPASNGSPITGYLLYSKEGTGSYDSGTLLGPDVTSYTFSGLTNGTVYTFKLTAANTVGVSGESNEATATPHAPSSGGVVSAPGNTVKVTIPGISSTVSITIGIAGTKAEVTSDETAFGKIFGNSAASETVTIDLSSLDNSVNEVVFPNSFVEALEDAVSGGASDISGLNIALPGGNSITLDNDALETICAAAGSGSLSFRIRPVAVGSLSSTMRGALNGESAGAVIEITVSSGSKEISDLGGTAKITFSVTIGSDVKSAKVYKLFSDGTRELVNSVLDLVNGKITIERNSLSTYAVIFSDKAEWVNPFADVTEKDWYYDDVAYVCGNDLMNGVSSTVFSPSGTTTRAMVATVLWRLEGEPSATAANPFTDVESGMWYSEAIAWAAEKGIVNGIGGGLFNPTANVTREQFAAMLYRYAQYKGYDISAASSANISAFADHSEVSGYAVPAMTWAYGEGIITGRTGTTLAPLGSAQRSELAAMLHRFLENSAG